jgi:Domain of unknown function DUF302
MSSHDVKPVKRMLSSRSCRRALSSYACAFVFADCSPLYKSPERPASSSEVARRDHGALLQISCKRRKALQYDIGNPPTASKMTRHQLLAALYAPRRVVLFEDEQGKGIFEYDKPSSLFG